MHGTHYLDIIFCDGVKIPQSAIDSIGIYTQTILSLIRYLSYQCLHLYTFQIPSPVCFEPHFPKKCLHLSTPEMTSIFHVEILYHSRDIILLYYVDTLYHNNIPPTQHFHPWYNFIKIKTRYLKHTLRSRTDPGNLSSDLD